MLVKNIYTFVACFSSIKRVVQAKVAWWRKGDLPIGWCFRKLAESDELSNACGFCGRWNNARNWVGMLYLS
ncbi:hypothetical protein CTM50_04330 [Prevotella intermedia]|uniref:Uncharacterized protein n=1 Tax=Prevotella intermedia TaxID=28131 RepID=A0A2D3NA94_PREIN|nr:hypothetical protein CTM50_04330 [Prevotella intermedia]